MGSLAELFELAGGGSGERGGQPCFGETQHMTKYGSERWRAAGLSRGGRDTDGEGADFWEGGGLERFFFFLIWNGPSEGSDLIIFGLGERASGGERRTQMESGGGARQGEEEACFLSTQLLSAAAVTSLAPRLAPSSSLRRSSAPLSLLRPSSLAPRPVVKQQVESL